MDIYPDAKRRGIYLGLFTNPERDVVLVFTKSAIFRVTGANQNALKLLFTDLVNTNIGKSIIYFVNASAWRHPVVSFNKY